MGLSDQMPLGRRGLSKLVNLRAARKLISDARTATYVMLSTGSGPGGRWFKSIRPDQFFQVQQLTKREKTEDRLVQDQVVSVQISSSRSL